MFLTKILYRLYVVLVIIMVHIPDVALTQERWSKEYVHTNFTTQDGLPSNETYFVFQDSKGYIWIGTDRGIVRYDGYEFKTFTEEDGVTDNAIFGIAEDSKGNIWFTTSNRTLCYYNGGDKVQPFVYNHLIQEIIDNKSPYHSVFFDQILIDEEDVLYISHSTWGYIKIPLNNPQQLEDNIYAFDYHIENDNRIEVVIEENYKNIFLSTCIGVIQSRSVNVEGAYKRKIDLGDSIWRYSRMYLLSDSTFLFGNILHRITETGVQSKSFPHYMHIFEDHNTYFVNTFNESGKGKVLLVDNHEELTQGVELLNIPIRLTSVLIDNNNGYWLTTLEKGVFYIPSLNYGIIQKDKNVTGLIPYGNGISMGSRNQNYLLDFSKQELSYLGNILRLDSLFGKTSNSITLSHQIRIKELDDWMTNFNKATSKLVSNILVHSDTLYYVLGLSGLSRYSKREGNKILHVFKGRVLTFELIDNEGMFIGLKNGIYKHDKSDEPKDNLSYEYDTSEPYIALDTKPKDLKWFKSKNILSIATTGKGILFYRDNKLIKKVTTKHGLVSNTVNQFYLDKNERLWVGTNKGINYIEIDKNDSIYVHNFMASSRNLLSPNVQQLYFFNDSILLIGTDRGLNEVKVDANLLYNSRILPIILTKASVNKSLPLKSKLSYEQNNIEFEFIAIEFNRFGSINYRYRLKGLSEEWIYTTERKATFLKLEPGNYTFELEAQNEKGDWIALEISPGFTINKPYWETWWFRLLILGMIGSVVYYYISNLKREKNLLEDKQKLSEELNESQQKALSSQLNPHFVFNSLNSIQNFILTRRTELSSDYLSMFSKLMRFIFENSKKLYVPLFDEIEALRLYLELEQVRHNHKFNYKIDSNTIQPTKYVIPSLLIQPMIENAIWHGLLHKESDNRLLEIMFKADDVYLNIEIKDNGVGRGHSKPRHKFIKKQRSSGVELTKQRLRLLTESTGLKTNFEIVDLFDEFGKPCGTLVKVSIPVNLK